MFCIVLAVLPLVAPGFATVFKFYEKTDVCLPLPISTPIEESKNELLPENELHIVNNLYPFVDIGHYYSFAIFIALNFLLFLFIGGGQLVIFYAVK